MKNRRLSCQDKQSKQTSTSAVKVYSNSETYLVWLLYCPHGDAVLSAGSWRFHARLARDHWPCLAAGSPTSSSVPIYTQVVMVIAALYCSSFRGANSSRCRYEWERLQHINVGKAIPQILLARSCRCFFWSMHTRTVRYGLTWNNHMCTQRLQTTWAVGLKTSKGYLIWCAASAADDAFIVQEPQLWKPWLHSHASTHARNCLS